MVAQGSCGESSARGSAAVSLVVLQAPLGHVADADDAHRPLARDDRDVAEATFDPRLPGLLDRCVLRHGHGIPRHPLAAHRLTLLNPAVDSPHTAPYLDNPQPP